MLRKLFDSQKYHYNLSFEYFASALNLKASNKLFKTTVFKICNKYAKLKCPEYYSKIHSNIPIKGYLNEFLNLLSYRKLRNLANNQKTEDLAILIELYDIALYTAEKCDEIKKHPNTKANHL